MSDAIYDVTVWNAKASLWKSKLTHYPAKTSLDAQRPAG
jgi:hypothetical protein